VDLFGEKACGAELPENAILLLLEFCFLLSFVQLNSFSGIRLLLLEQRERVVRERAAGQGIGAG
jgi:hypothetical protein